ncbi:MULTISPECIES: ATP-binding protein [Rhodomicrobium]|uniref:sensor histidine kinase n=1 Tax=Rhodomicrobium TaxID=1068 RepID=UPI00148277BF|nr:MULTISPECIES: ATP-binding protein [Rhodomicrobium]
MTDEAGALGPDAPNQADAPRGESGHGRPLLFPALAAALALAIFLFDSLSSIGIAVAVLYGIVVLIGATFSDRRGVIMIAAGCALLTLLGFAIGHASDPEEEAPFLRCLISLAALTVTTVLAVKNQTATKVLAASEQRYRSIFQTTAVAIWEEDYSQLAAALDQLPYRNPADLDAYLSENPAFVRACMSLIRTIDVNDSALRLVDADSRTQLMTSLPQIFTSESLPMLKGLLMTVAARRDYYEAESLLQTFKGEKRSVFVAATFAPEPHRFNSVLVSVMDITERNKVQRALEQARAELTHMSRVTMLGELTASIAHEVNQPLAAIVSNGQACLRWLDRPVPDMAEARANVEQIVGQGRRAANVVQRLRALSKNSGPQRIRLNINDVIKEAVSLVDQELREHEVSLRLELAPGLPKVSVDRIQLQQVIINLAINAMQAMRTVEERELRIASRMSQEGLVEIAVSDCGIGLSDAEMAQLFTAFYTTKPQGMGMGLSICQTIVEAHGGSIRAERNDGPGATFRVLLVPNVPGAS